MVVHAPLFNPSLEQQGLLPISLNSKVVALSLSLCLALYFWDWQSVEIELSIYAGVVSIPIVPFYWHVCLHLF